MKEYSTASTRMALMVACVLFVGIFLDLIETLPMIVEYREYYDLRSIAIMLANSTVSLIGAVYLLLNKHENMTKVLGTTAIVMGFICLMSSYILLVEYRELLDRDLGIFLEGVVMLVMALMLMVNAFTYIRGLSQSTKAIKYGIYAFIALYVLTAIISLRYGNTLRQLYEDQKENIMPYTLIVLMLIMLSSETVKVNTVNYNITSSIRDMRNAMVVEGMSIDHATVRKILALNEGALWCRSYSSLMTTFNKENYIFSMSRGDDGLQVRIYAVDNSSSMNDFRFLLNGVWTDTGDPDTCDLVRLYGPEGFFIQLIAVDQKRKSKRLSRLKEIQLLSYEKGTWTYTVRIRIKNSCEFLKSQLFAPGYERKRFE